MNEFKPIPYGRQHITQEDINAVVLALEQPYLTTGPTVQLFEEKFAQYVGSKYAVAVSNGTAALHLCALALGVDKRSNVIVPPITFAASANCIRYCGGNVFFADIDRNSATLDIDAVKSLIASKPTGFFSGIVPVDFAGYAVNLEEFRQLADEHGLWIIEDSCHAPGGYFHDSNGTHQRCGNGNFADLAIFSFHPVKHIACGEGGMITTNNEQYYHKLKQLRSHGMIYQNDDRLKENHGGWYMEMQDLGYNYRIPDILCALGISQLERANEGITRRRLLANNYDKAFQGTQVSPLNYSHKDGHAYHLYVVQVQNRKEIYESLKLKNIYSQIHYIPVHLMPYYKDLGHKIGEHPISESYYEHCLSLPMYPSLTDSEQEFIIRTLLSLV